MATLPALEAASPGWRPIKEEIRRFTVPARSLAAAQAADDKGGVRVWSKLLRRVCVCVCVCATLATRTACATFYAVTIASVKLGPHLKLLKELNEENLNNCFEEFSISHGLS